MASPILPKESPPVTPSSTSETPVEMTTDRKVSIVGQETIKKANAFTQVIALIGRGLSWIGEQAGNAVSWFKTISVFPKTSIPVDSTNLQVDTLVDTRPPPRKLNIDDKIEHEELDLFTFPPPKPVVSGSKKNQKSPFELHDKVVSHEGDRHIVQEIIKDNGDGSYQVKTRWYDQVGTYYRSEELRKLKPFKE